MPKTECPELPSGIARASTIKKLKKIQNNYQQILDFQYLSGIAQPPAFTPTHAQIQNLRRLIPQPDRNLSYGGLLDATLNFFNAIISLSNMHLESLWAGEIIRTVLLFIGYIIFEIEVKMVRDHIIYGQKEFALYLAVTVITDEIDMMIDHKQIVIHPNVRIVE